MSSNYNSVDIKRACDGADLAIACLGTGMTKLMRNCYQNA